MSMIFFSKPNKLLFCFCKLLKKTNMKLKNLLQGMLACSLLCSLVVIQACDDDDEPKDTLAPEVSFTNLIEGMTVWNTVPISLDATDDQGIEEIQVFADGNLITTLTASPFETNW